jgi:hypothetical protein
MMAFRHWLGPLALKIVQDTYPKRRLDVFSTKKISSRDALDDNQLIILTALLLSNSERAASMQELET